MNKWQIFLGGFASASILAVGLAAPALAQATATSSGLPLSNVAQAVGVQGLSGTSGVACDIQGVPLSGEVTSAASALTSCSSSSQSSSSSTQQPASNPLQFSATQNAQPSSQTNSPAGSMASGLPGLSMVTGVIPGLGSATSSLPLSTMTGAAPNSTSDASTSNAPRIGANDITPDGPSSAANSASSSDPTSNNSVVPGALGGVTGALPALGSLSGGLPGLGTVTGALSGGGSSGNSTALP